MNLFRSEEEFHSNLLLLPSKILEKILSFLSYDETSSARPVSKKFDSLCRARLNEGLNQVDRLHSQIHREIKGKLPRRESERRNHVLARHVDVLGAVETRLSLLNMTYSKYIEMGLCCFIPGRVLDEIFHVLRKIQTLANPPRAHELLQELRDISSMAIEHFDEKIAPLLRKPQRISFMDSLESLTNEEKTGKSKPRRSNSVTLRIGRTLSLQQKSIVGHKRRIGTLQKQLSEVRNLNGEFQRQQTEQNRRITELEQKIVDYDQKIVDMTVEISRVRAASGLAGGDGSAPKEGLPQTQTEGLARGSGCADAQSDATSGQKASSVEGKTQMMKRKSRCDPLRHAAKFPEAYSMASAGCQEPRGAGSVQTSKVSKSSGPRRDKRKADCDEETHRCPKKVLKR